MCQGTRKDHEESRKKHASFSYWKLKHTEAEKEEKFLDIVSAMMGLNTVSMEIRKLK